MAASGGALGEFGESLQREALSEMADSFFGSRRLIEEEIEQLHATLGELEAIGERALDRLCLLHALLVDQDTLLRFYDHLDIKNLGDLLHLLEGRSPRLGFPLPGGLRFSARYLRLFELVYTFAHDACQTYMHGRHRRDPVSGTQGLTLHYHQIEAWCAAMNRRIAHLNSSQPPSLVMSYARKLQSDPGRTTIFGATLAGIGVRQDACMGLPALECDEIGLGPLPALPSPVQASEVVRDFAKAVHAAHGETLRELMRNLETERAASLKAINDSIN